nr:MAG TPA: hypothetical protein [Caudoviricetes sp.]
MYRCKGIVESLDVTRVTVGLEASVIRFELKL